MEIRTRIWMVAAVAVAVALTTGCAANVASPPAGHPSSAREVPSPSASPTPSPAPTPAPSTTTVTAHASACTAAALDPRPIYESDAAMGSSLQTVVVHNITHTACRLDSPVTLLYTDRHGIRHRLPTSRGDTTPPAPYVVPPGGYAEFVLRTANGRPSGDACGPETNYTGLSVVLSGGMRFLLRGMDIDVSCPHVGPGELNGVEATDWGASMWPTPEGASISRAPAP